jgi:hypothetical protein
LKKELEGRNFRSENEMISTARAILKAISIWKLFDMLAQWIARLQRCITNEGEHV